MQVSIYALPGLREKVQLPVTHQPDELIDLIKRIVLGYYRLTADQVFRKTRKRESVLARQVMMSLAKRFTNKSLKSIGEAFPHGSPYDHTSVMHSCNTVNDLLDSDPLFYRQYYYMVSMVLGVPESDVEQIENAMCNQLEQNLTKQEAPVVSMPLIREATVPESEKVISKYL